LVDADLALLTLKSGCSSFSTAGTLARSTTDGRTSIDHRMRKRALERTQAQ
jgi:hypothetical protein